MARTKNAARIGHPKSLPRATFPPAKQQRYRPCIKALQEIRKYQNNSHQLCENLPFKRLIKWHLKLKWERIRNLREKQ
jgi:hypothetical protein